MKKIKLFETFDINENNLPAKFEIGEEVILDFGDNGKLTDCYIRNIIFTNAKVRYSIYLGKSETTIHNIDSVFILETGKEKNVMEFEFEFDDNNS